MTEGPTVLLTTEGTYPYAEGGVSTWCDTLIRQLPEIDFRLFSLVSQPGLRQRFSLPENVVGLQQVPLWGTGAANEIRREVGWWSLHAMRRPVAQAEVIAEFGDVFHRFLTGLLAETGQVAEMGEAVGQLARLFQRYDYDALFRHPATWQIFQRHARRFVATLAQAESLSALSDRGTQRKRFEPPRLIDAVEALRLLYRWLTPLAMPIPEVDLVHASAAGLACLPGIAARWSTGTPLLLTEHGVYLRERLLALSESPWPNFLKVFARRVTRRLVELSYQTADLISPVSSWNVRWEEHLGAAPERIMPVANGVDSERFAPQPFPEGRPTLVWVGRIDPLKDLLTLIDSVAILQKTIVNVQLLLFGKAPGGNHVYEARCRERVAELGLEETIVFKGHESSPEAAYAQGHFVVLSSISEAMPFSVIEAMLCGRAVVATAVGGVPEVVGDCGVIVPPRDPQAFANACLELLQSGVSSAALGEMARQRALSHYTLDRFVSAYRSLYALAAPASSPIPKPISVRRSAAEAPVPLRVGRAGAFAGASG